MGGAPARNHHANKIQERREGREGTVTFFNVLGLAHESSAHQAGRVKKRCPNLQESDPRAQSLGVQWHSRIARSLI